MEQARCVLLSSHHALALRGTASYLHTTGVVVTYKYSLLKLVLDQGIQTDSRQLVSLAPPLPLLHAVGQQSAVVVLPQSYYELWVRPSDVRLTYLVP